MNDKRKDNAADDRNEGEGNRTAAREYNQAQQRFVKSGEVEKKAREAERDLRNPDTRRESEAAEIVGKRHAAKKIPRSNAATSLGAAA
jgi:hypothetical protein